jgi:hypothetical protein
LLAIRLAQMHHQAAAPSGCLTKIINGKNIASKLAPTGFAF